VSTGSVWTQRQTNSNGDMTPHCMSHIIHLLHVANVDVVACRVHKTSVQQEDQCT